MSDNTELPFPYNKWTNKDLKSNSKISKDIIKAMMLAILTAFILTFLIAGLAWYLYNYHWRVIFDLPKVGYWLWYFSIFVFKLVITK